MHLVIDVRTSLRVFVRSYSTFYLFRVADVDKTTDTDGGPFLEER